VERLDEYLERLASREPVPGGGSAATIVAAIGAALVGMAARITAANPRYAERKPLAESIAARADALRARLIEAGKRDEEAFAAVMAARGPQRQEALVRAAQAPLDAAQTALEVQRLAADALALDNPHLASDLACACEFAAAALAAGAYNVRVNHRAMTDERTVEAQRSTLEGYEGESATLLRRVRETVR
jgi:methenyltetrahydrofolate cyclohydrolase